MLLRTVQLKNLQNTSREQGFTLVELLIVIAILGVLAAVLIVSINPLEQLARARDAGRIQAVAQMGHVMGSYFTSQQLAAYPGVVGTSTASWQTTYLVAAKEEAAVAAVSSNGVTVCPSNEGGLCYAPGTKSVAGDTALIWTPLESQAQKSLYTTKAGSACAGYLVSMYDSSQGKQGLACLAATATVPAAGVTIY